MSGAMRTRERISAGLRASAATRWIPDLARRVAGDSADLYDRIRGKPRPWWVPPNRLKFVGGGDFVTVGRRYASMLQAYGRLGPGASVLDVGSGVGRIAVALIPVLGDDGIYEGFDVVPDAVRWCQQEITSRHPNFRFRLADVRNGLYNPRGRVAPESYRFPCDDESFDLVVATSLFTHLRPAETANYLKESRRVLRGGGRLFATWFLVDGPSGVPAHTQRREEAQVELEESGFRAVSRRLPEFAVAAQEEKVRQLHERAGFSRLEMHYAEKGRSQDIIVAFRSND